MMASAPSSWAISTFFGLVVQVARDAQVHVDLRAQALSHTVCIQTRMVDVCRDGNGSLRHTFPNPFGIPALLFGNTLHLRRDKAGARGVDLRDGHAKSSLRWHYPIRFDGLRPPTATVRRCCPDRISACSRKHPGIRNTDALRV